MSNDGWSPSPEADWRIFDRFDVVGVWLETNPPREYVEQLHLWLMAVEVNGPPQDQVAVSEANEHYVARIPETPLTISYFVVPYEFRIILDTIE